MSAMFRSLQHVNFRLWFAGSLVSNVGTWMQRTAQDWIVLTDLSDHNALAIGIVMALQFGPQVLLFPITGWAADRFPKRKLLLLTQGSMGLLGLGLGILLLSGTAQLWHVYVFAFLLGVAAAFDAPARQSFLTELVSETNVSNAIALNSASFNSARLVGPAVAGVLIAVIGAGWVFVINAVSFLAVFASLLFLRGDQLRNTPRTARGSGGMLQGLVYVWRRSDLLIVFVMGFLVGTFAFNYPIFTATMATQFEQGSQGFGLLTSALAVGSVTGALLAARRERPRLRLLIAAAALLGAAFCLTAAAPVYIVFALALVPVGLFAQSFMATANGLVQTGTDPRMRGRVMALYIAIFLGGTPIGAPIIGATADTLGPRWAILVGGSSAFVACVIGLVWLIVARHLRVSFDREAPVWIRVHHDGLQRGALETELAADEATATRGS